MVAAESVFEIPQQDEICLVSQRKYNLDPTRPWWERLYFRCLFLPFVRFSFKYMHVPAPAAMEADGRIVIIEQQRVCLDPKRAEAVCKSQDEFWSWKSLPLDVDLPKDSVQYKGHRNPLSIVPDRYRRRTFPVATAPVQQLKQLKRVFETISEKATSHK